LVYHARRRPDRVVATIFVNPLQFGANEDLDRYPRQEDKDAEMLEQAGCNLLWLPQGQDMYPPGFATNISVKGVSYRWEGEIRPGHFDGVATVVAKLLCAVRPDIAIFGEKDFQQLAVIRRMTQDLQLGVQILGHPTIRDADGLALSSRNAYLSSDERRAALALPQALDEAAERISSGVQVAEALAQAKDRLDAAGFSRIDYVALVNALTLEPLEQAGGPMRLIAAAVIGRTRLIDNLAVDQ
jgi:pantoate--beta-alanine ligase